MAFLPFQPNKNRDRTHQTDTQGKYQSLHHLVVAAGDEGPKETLSQELLLLCHMDQRQRQEDKPMPTLTCDDLDLIICEPPPKALILGMKSD